MPPIPLVQPDGAPAAWSLLYVGIAPRRLSRTGVDRAIASRVNKDHRGGNIGSSTFRQSLAVILRGGLSLEPMPGHGRARVTDEQPLSDWIEHNCALTTAAMAKPWLFEDDVIRVAGAPLNLVPGYHTYRHVVREARDRLRRECRA